MKKFWLVILCIFFMSAAFADEDYNAVYESTQPADFTLLKNIDPYQEKDYYDYAWAPYPLFRTSSTLIFKDIKIEPGYYLLAARNMHGRDYVFFKEQGFVKHIVPVFKKEMVPPFFYENHIPQPKKTRWEEFTSSFQTKMFKKFKNSKRQPPPNAYIQSQNIDKTYSVIILYYGNDKYYMLFKKQLY